MRTILVALFLILYYIISLPLWLIGWLIGKADETKRAVFSQKLTVIAFRIILFISGVKVTVKGEENILKDQSALYAFNHRGFFDILVGYVTAPYPSLYVAKKEMEKVPLIARWMRYMNCLFLDRSDIRQGMKTIKEGIELLKNGRSIYIAPEGTRNHEKDLLPFHEASFKLAQNAKCPIVPVALTHTDDVLENHMPWIHATHIVIEYCAPISMGDMTRDEKKHVGEKVRSIIAETLEKNQA